MYEMLILSHFVYTTQEEYVKTGQPVGLDVSSGKYFHSTVCIN